MNPVSFLDYLLCIPFWVASYYSLRMYWRDKNDVQAKYALLTLFFMALSLTLLSPFLFRAIVRFFNLKNITRLMVDFFSSVSIYCYYVTLTEVSPPYRRHLWFIRLHLLLVLIILFPCFFLSQTQRELLFAVTDSKDGFNFAGNLAFLSFFSWSSGIGVVHFRKQVAAASDFFLKVRLSFVVLTCFLALIYCVFKSASLVFQRFSPSYTQGPFFFATARFIVITVGILVVVILSMPKQVKWLIKYFYDFFIYRFAYSNSYRLSSILVDSLSALRSIYGSITPHFHLKRYYLSALGEKIGVEYEAIQQIKEASLIFDARQRIGNNELREVCDASREVLNPSQARDYTGQQVQACPRARPERSEGTDYSSRQEMLSDVHRELIDNDLASLGMGQADDLNQLYFFSNLYQILRHIGEKYDGTGQPSGLAEDNIPLGSRIIRVVNYYMIQTAAGIEPETVIKGLQEGSGTVFDPQIVQAFLEVLAEGLGTNGTAG